ncbi:MAG: AAA family ATPase [Candidatus Riflebacteria bacterium]|nr:AAA family ATPase [Candidatus Riflebacteria bacterium]
MGIYVNPNNDGFKQSLNSKIYVDKSGMIEITNSLLDTRQNCMCISRPRRFGKSMGIDLLVAYYSKGCDSKELFSNLKIAQNPDFEKHLNKYNVIWLNLPKFYEPGSSIDTLLPTMISELKEELKEEFSQILENTNKPLQLLLSDIYKKTNEKFIVLVDEWDFIFRESTNSKVQEEYVNFLRILFKDSPFIKLAYITGILPVKKYNTQSALNNFDEYSMVVPDKMAEYFGFTEDEVKILCTTFDRDFNEIKAWYDGYLMPGNVHLYNPRSVVKAMDGGMLQSYWNQTSSFEALRIPINLNLNGIRETVLELMGGTRVSINATRFENDINSIKSRDEALTLLVHLGYLGYDQENREVFIPNREIRGEFDNALEASEWQEVIRALNNSEKLLKATWNCDENAVAEYIEQAHMDISSILGYNNEETLRSIVSIAYYTAIRFYQFKKEFPCGKGFADMVFLPYKHVNKPLIVIELKHNKTADSAIAQIKEKKYPESFKRYSGDILLVGITYDDDKKHYCKIERITKP